MDKQRALWVALVVAACCLHARGADKYTDENRPYEFGFNIEGEQHRHEKKDENGLIMGEFGFITADGVYHVTVYATDENGNFKILSMKNIRVKPYPAAPMPQSRAIEFPPAEKPVQPIAQSPVPPSKPIALSPLPIASPVRACSGCSIPTSTTQAPKPQLSDLAVVSRDNEQFPPYPNQQSNTRGRQFNPESNQVDVPVKPNDGYVPPKYDNEQSQPNVPPKNNQFNPSGQPGLMGDQDVFGQQDSREGQPPGEQLGQLPGQFNQQSGLNNQPAGQFGQQPEQIEQQPAQFGQQPEQLGQQPGQYGQQPEQFSQQPGLNSQQDDIQQPGSQRALPNDAYDNQSSAPNQPEQPPAKPQLISAQMRIVDKDTDINKRGPGEREGLPSGLEKDDMLQLLYTFNYTVGFHGHHEEGYTNGVKKGYYFVTGRDGVRTRIDYVADGEGFHPKISTEVLDLLSDDVPKPETEKEDKFGLKGYEFKWIYFPLNSRR